MSLRRRVAALAALVVLLAVGIFGALTVSRTRDALVRRTDQELAAIASGLMTFAQQQTDRVGRGRRPLRFQRLERLQLPDTISGLAVVVLPTGRAVPLPRLAREGTADPPVPDDVLDHVGAGAFDLEGRFRALVVRVAQRDSVIFAALSLAAVDKTVRDLIRTQAITGAVVVALCSILLLVSVRIGLRPLDAVTGAARDMASGAAPTRVRTGLPGTEIGALTQALNDMFSTIERSSAQREEAQRRTETFAADAAHELRTPITSILGYAELYQHGGLEDERSDEVFARIRAEAGRLRHLVDGLLVLNRLVGAGPEDAEPEGVELGELAALAAADSLAIDPTHPLTVDVRSPVTALARRDEVFQILANLLANVRTHTPPGTAASIAIRPGEDPATVVIEVSDSGPGIAPADRAHVFDRFYRPSGGRPPSPGGSADGGGSGLGLAIVRALARANGGDAMLAASRRPGTAVQVRLPALKSD